jgi:hypothetical protein
LEKEEAGDAHHSLLLLFGKYADTTRRVNLDGW